MGKVRELGVGGVRVELDKGRSEKMRLGRERELRNAKGNPLG